MPGTELSHRAEKGFFCGIVRMGKYCRDVITGIQQRLQSDTANIVISENDSFRAHGATLFI
ncbi:Selenocysteine lyase/Cysteine desulfurase [Pseudomonas syringae pv. actinidiae]|uniref:Selenocysteine lyase/Cysteine desulfurase n=1 Tax=Pseudomonas syringae pv. actinidiae TaxID=103796 RepID=A0A2V0QIJ5_PSESF|nr:Selenocysteine lyase/Cysteine desulfurase [Pseudomonas syringae pv. actinidiae]